MIVYVAVGARSDLAERSIGHEPQRIAILRKLAAAQQVVFVDAGAALFEQVRQGTALDTLLPEDQGGLHPSDAGHAIYFRAVRKALANGRTPRDKQPPKAPLALGSAHLEPVDRITATGCEVRAFPSTLEHLSHSLVCPAGASLYLTFKGTSVGFVRGVRIEAP